MHKNSQSSQFIINYFKKIYQPFTNYFGNIKDITVPKSDFVLTEILPL